MCVNVAECKGNLIFWQSVLFAPLERRATTREAAVLYNGTAQRSDLLYQSGINAHTQLTILAHRKTRPWWGRCWHCLWKKDTRVASSLAELPCQWHVKPNLALMFCRNTMRHHEKHAHTRPTYSYLFLRNRNQKYKNAFSTNQRLLNLKLI